MEPFKKLKSLGIFLGIALVIFGIALLIWPDNIIEFLAIIIGVGVSIIGAVKIIIIAKGWKKKESGKFPKIALAILLVVLGIYILINSNVTITAIGVCIGIFAIISSLDRLSTSIERKKLGYKIMQTVCFGVASLAFGIGMIFASLKVLSIVLSLVGIYLIVEGIMIIVSSMLIPDIQNDKQIDKQEDVQTDNEVQNENDNQNDNSNDK